MVEEEHSRLPVFVYSKKNWKKRRRKKENMRGHNVVGTAISTQLTMGFKSGALRVPSLSQSSSLKSTGGAMTRSRARWGVQTKLAAVGARPRNAHPQLGRSFSCKCPPGMQLRHAAPRLRFQTIPCYISLHPNALPPERRDQPSEQSGAPLQLQRPAFAGQSIRIE
jgi:hypothetical protein